MVDDDAELAALAAQTLAIYQRQAAHFDADRNPGLVERAWLERWLATVPAGGHLLDLGCGTGAPIARHLLGLGYRVTGVDGCAAMLERARDRLPTATWIHTDMRALDLAQRFDGIVAWDSVFHLPPDDQRALVPRLARHLVPGGALMLTVGPAAGEVVGRVGDEAVYHASLDPDDYRALFAQHGLQVVHFVTEDATCGGHSIVVAVAGQPAVG